MLPAEDPAVRRSGIGGSDAAAVVGLNPYLTRLEVYALKLGLIEPEEVGEPAEWGKILEPVVLRQYAMRTGFFVVGRDRSDEISLFRPDGGVDVADGPAAPAAALLRGTIRSRTHPWRYCHPDGFAVDLSDGTILHVLEGKTANVWIGRDFGIDGTDQIPEGYVLQCMHNLDVLREHIGSAADTMRVPVLIGGQQWRIYTVPYDPAMADVLREEEQAFWERIQKGEPPGVTPDDQGKRVLARLFPKDFGERIRATEEDIKLVEELAEMRQAFERAQRARTEAENQIKERMGTASELVGPGFKITWKKTRDRKVTDWEAALRRLSAQAGLSEPKLNALISEYTEVRDGYRSFRVRIENSDEEDEE